MYSKRIRELVKSEDNSLVEGVYAHWRGPAYETPAEIHMMRTLGADLVGMSTVPEAVAAHALGAEVLGISLVTNAAAGVTGKNVSQGMTFHGIGLCQINTVRMNLSDFVVQ